MPGDRGLTQPRTFPLKLCSGCGRRGPVAFITVSDVREKHALYSQIPSGGQVLNGAEAGYFQEQLHPVNCKQEDAVSSGPATASATPGLARFLLETLLRSGHVPSRHPRHTRTPERVWAPGQGLAQMLANRGCPLTRSTRSHSLGVAAGIVCPSNRYFLSPSPVPAIALGAGCPALNNTELRV